MNPEQSNPLQPQDDQQPYQNPDTPPQTFGQEQPPITPQAQYPPYQPSKQASKLPFFIIGGVVIIFGIAVGIFLLLNGNSGSRTDQSGSNQATSIAQEEQTEKTALEEGINESEISAQNNTKHKNNLAKLVAAVSQYSANNNGKLPTASEINSAFISQYMSGQFNDPSTSNPYKIVDTNPKSGEIQYKTSSTCGSDNNIIAGSSRQVAARVLLSDSAYYCASN